VDESSAAIALLNESGDAIGWQRGTVLGLYTHGLFESTAAIRALFGVEPPSLDGVFEGLADFVERGFEPGVLSSLVGQ
jgi:adenosylcobyric acid synthase